MGFDDDRQIEITVARACLSRGLIATGFGSLIITTPDGERSRVADDEPPHREIVAAQVWRVVERADRTDQIHHWLNWRGGSIGFELVGQECTDGATIERRYSGLVFDAPGVAALLADTDPAPAKVRRRGRPPGKVQYLSDEAVVDEVCRLVRAGEASTPTAAARTLIHLAEGPSEDANLKRIARKATIRLDIN